MKNNAGRKPDPAKASQGSPMKSIFEDRLRFILTQHHLPLSIHADGTNGNLSSAVNKIAKAHREDIDSAVKAARIEEIERSNKSFSPTYGDGWSTYRDERLNQLLGELRQLDKEL